MALLIKLLKNNALKPYLWKAFKVLALALGTLFTGGLILFVALFMRKRKKKDLKK